MPQRRQRKALNIKCTDSKCESNLHCFRATSEMRENDQEGRCRNCGVELIDWKRVHRRDLNDVTHTFTELKRELIRHHFWHCDIDLKAQNHARRKGVIKMRDAVRSRIEKSVGSDAPFRDGYQTPYEGNVIFYAQHAIACCCRKCLEYWHNIPSGRALSSQELDYLTELVMLYISERLPILTKDGEKIPHNRKKKPK